MNCQITPIKILSYTLPLLFNSVKVYARSINTDSEANSNDGSTYKIPFIVCIIGVVAVAASGGFCLFSSKKSKRASEQYLNKSNSSQSCSSSSSVSVDSHKELKPEKNELEEVDITIPMPPTEAQNNNITEADEQEDKNGGKKRRSILDTLLKRNSTTNKRHSNVHFIEDRSLNSISTNEDWIEEQKYQAGLYEEDGDNMEDNNSNDGFWNSDLEPIQSSSNNKQESYAVPSLGKRNSVIVRGSSDKMKSKHQSVIILDDNNNNLNSGSSIDSNSSGEIRPTRVKSWKNNNLDEEIKEIMKKMDEIREENI